MTTIICGLAALLVAVFVFCLLPADSVEDKENNELWEELSKGSEKS